MRIKVTIQLPSDIEADLIAEARAQGLDLAQFVEQVLREEMALRMSSAPSPAEFAEAPFCARASAHAASFR